MKRSRTHLGKGSSLMATTPGLALWGALTALCLWQGLGALSCFFLFLLIMGGLARWWGKRSINEVEIGIECSRTGLFPDSFTTLTYTVKNKKAIPLPWLELSQSAPRKDCLVPEGAFERYIPMGTENGKKLPPALRQTIPYVGGWETLQADTHWKAKRRGIYNLGGILARSGDAFGLVQNELGLPNGSFPVIAVYPRRVNINLDLFLRNQWFASSGDGGWLEDNTVLRGIRDYQPGDNPKHINWRLAARGQGIQTNLFQKVRPRRIHFILDGESFCREEDENKTTYKKLEKILEILASVILGLTEQGVSASLTTPKSLFYPAQTIEAEAGDFSTLLFCLAGYEPLHAKISEGGEYEPSHFPSHIPAEEVNCFLFTQSGSLLPQEILRQLDANTLHILCEEDQDSALALGYKVSSIDLLKAEGGRE